jgi:hypothetical protein
MAMAIPMSTNTTIAACIQIQVGDIGSRQDRWWVEVVRPTVWTLTTTQQPTV